MKNKINLKLIIGISLVIALLILPFYLNDKHNLFHSTSQTSYGYDSMLSLSELKDDATHLFSSNKTEKVNGQKQSILKPSFVYKKHTVEASKKKDATVSDKKIIPGGHSIGVQLHTLGVVVVGHHLVEEISPGEDASIEVGDIILEMNGTKIKKLEDVKPIVRTAGKDNENIKVKIKRGKEVIETSLSPTLNQKDNNYQIGLYIRDATSGIGTVSFIDDETGKYGALGHIISDSDTKKPIEIHKGKLVRSKITSIDKGGEGIPGEKKADFSIKDKKLGNVKKNSPFGIFGKLNKKLLENEIQKPMPIGLSHEVEKGPAEILTVVKDEKIEKFDIEIINSTPQKSAATKGMVIKITDERLLDKAGGIVQGMSGSPIIQNDKIIGAVTHVFVNDPTSGYGVHIEWMLDQAEIDVFNRSSSRPLQDAI